MEGSDTGNKSGSSRLRPGRDTTDSSTQTDCKIRGHGPRLSEVNLFTLLSLWMELFPQEHPQEDSQIRGMGLVVVRDSKVVGLHCSGPELHAGQAAVIQHGASLADCQLYFSRRPCATCLKMIVNVEVKLISFWPGDPEFSILKSHFPPDNTTEEAALDALASERLKSNSCSHICVRLQPLAPGLAQFVDETSRECDFMKRVSGPNSGEIFDRERTRLLKDFSGQFLVETTLQHQDILTQIGLESFSVEPCLSNLRNNMRELVEVLAAVAAALPQQHYGFYREQHPTSGSSLDKSSAPHHTQLSQEGARHCIIQARLLAYRTEDPKVGVGAVIWAQRHSASSNGTGRLYLVGCGYNAYPAGSQYAEYPQLDTTQGVRQRCKYRYIIHAEQNALTFRTQTIKPEEPTMMFVTKCPCDECVPLITGAGVTHIYTTDQDRNKQKADISYLKFSSMKNVTKFIWQRSPSPSSLSTPQYTNGRVRKAERCGGPRNKRRPINRMCNTDTTG